MRSLHRILATVAMLLVLCSSGFAASTAAQPAAGPAAARYADLDPDDPALHAIARDALRRAKVLDIVFPEGSALSGRVTPVDQAIKALGGRVIGQQIVVELPADVLFDFDRAALRQDALASLTTLGTVIRGTALKSVRVQGHTDGIGDDAYNDRLSLQRARSVADWLVANTGVRAAIVTTEGFGRRRPKASERLPTGGDDAAGRQQNRRVEVVMERAGA